jgi:hypothetical protein
MKNTMFLLPFLVTFIFSACSKKSTLPETYTGRVIGACPNCTVLEGRGNSFLLEFSNDNKLDTINTGTLPDNFKVGGQKITFRLRNQQDDEPNLVCNSSNILPRTVVVYDVK